MELAQVIEGLRGQLATLRGARIELRVLVSKLPAGLKSEASVRWLQTFERLIDDEHEYANWDFTLQDTVIQAEDWVTYWRKLKAERVRTKIEQLRKELEALDVNFD